MVLGLGGGNGIAVKVTAKTSDALSGFQRLQDELTDFRSSSMQAASSLGWFSEQADDARDDSVGLSIAMQALQSRTDAAEDELDSAARSAFLTGGAFTTLSASTGWLTFSISGLTTALVPVVAFLTTLATMLAPLATAFLTVAAAGASVATVFGGLTALTVATHMKKIKAAFNETMKAVQSILKPLADAFLPALMWVISEIPDLAKQIRSVLLPHMEELAWWFTEIASQVMDSIPAVISTMVDLARTALPMVNSALEALQGAGPAIFEQMLSVTRRMAPFVMDVGRAFAQLAGPLTKFGVTVSSVVLPAFADFLRLLSRGLRAFNNLTQSVKKSGKGTLASFKSTFRGIENIVAKTIGRVQQILQTHLPKALKAARGILNNLKKAWAIVGDDVTTILQGLLSAALGILGTLLDAFATLVTGVLQILNGNFGGALKTFVGFFKRLFTGLLKWVRSWGDDLGAALLRIIADSVEAAGTHLANFLSNIPGIKVAGSTITKALSGGLVSELRATANTLDNTNTRGQGERTAVPKEIVVTGELTTENGEVKAVIDERIETKQRQVRRLSRARNHRG